MESYYVYMLRCADGSYYTGVTNDIRRRVGQHMQGIDAGCYTFKRRPVTLAYVSEFGDIRDAIAWEKTLKRWSRKKKEALMKGEIGALKRYSFNGYRKRIDDIRRYFCASTTAVMVSPTNHDSRTCHPSSGSG